jgi:hypothetical protein
LNRFNFVIPERELFASEPESIITTERMDSGPAREERAGPE